MVVHVHPPPNPSRLGWTGAPAAQGLSTRRLAIMVGAVVVAHGVGEGHLRSELLTTYLGPFR